MGISRWQICEPCCTQVLPSTDSAEILLYLAAEQPLQHDEWTWYRLDPTMSFAEDDRHAHDENLYFLASDSDPSGTAYELLKITKPSGNTVAQLSFNAPTGEAPPTSIADDGTNLILSGGGHRSVWAHSPNDLTQIWRWGIPFSQVNFPQHSIRNHNARGGRTYAATHPGVSPNRTPDGVLGYILNSSGSQISVYDEANSQSDAIARGFGTSGYPQQLGTGDGASGTWISFDGYSKWNDDGGSGFSTIIWKGSETADELYLYDGSHVYYRKGTTIYRKDTSTAGGTRIVLYTQGAGRTFRRADVIEGDALYVREDVGGTTEKQQIALSGPPTGGTFTLTWPTSGETTSPIAYNATATQVRDAIENDIVEIGERTVGATPITASGGPLPGTPVVIDFENAFGHDNIAQLTIDDSGLVGGTGAVTTTDDGDGGFGFAKYDLAGGGLVWERDAFYDEGGVPFDAGGGDLYITGNLTVFP